MVSRVATAERGKEDDTDAGGMSDGLAWTASVIVLESQNGRLRGGYPWERSLETAAGTMSRARVPSVAVSCEFCGVLMAVEPSEVRRGRGRFCSRRCVGASSKGRASPGSGQPPGLASTERQARRAAYSKYDWARRSGKLKKQPYEVCGDPDAQGHHDDYNKPLEVRWFCGKHHRMKHRASK